MKRLLAFLLCAIVLLDSCKKKDDDVISPSAVFNFDCASIAPHGSYYVGTSLINTNTLAVQVNVSKTGTYSISTATINGFRFSGSGSFSATGTQTLILQGTGIPSSAGSFVFAISAGTNTCTFFVNTNFTIPSFVDNDNMLFGNPSRAASLIDSNNNYLMRRPYYSESYSQVRGTPNWVSWHLFSNDVGSTPRQDDFRPDNELPAGWYQVQNNSYSGSGFDRGHNCPSGDRTSSVSANSSTFLMTNMIPQAPNMNQLTWGIMEDSLRRLVTLGNEVYIIMGSYGAGGTGTNGLMTTINGGNVTVPANIWKVALVIPNGNNDSSRVDANVRLIAVKIPNSNTATANWKTYRTSVDMIEAATGYDLLDRLPLALQAIIENRVDAL